MAFNPNKFITDVSERAVSTGWQVALGVEIAGTVFHNPSLAVPISIGLSFAKSLLVKFYQSNAEAQRLVKEAEPVIKDVAEAAEVVDPALAPVVQAVEKSIDKSVGPFAPHS